jgi:hypothetical protein
MLPIRAFRAYFLIPSWRSETEEAGIKSALAWLHLWKFVGY